MGHLCPQTTHVSRPVHLLDSDKLTRSGRDSNTNRSEGVQMGTGFLEALSLMLVVAVLAQRQLLDADQLAELFG